jgi:hypothetical protein
MHSTDDSGSARSDMITYQPSPFNNNMDLNELLQNVGDGKLFLDNI